VYALLLPIPPIALAVSRPTRSQSPDYDGAFEDMDLDLDMDLGATRDSFRLVTMAALRLDQSATAPQLPQYFCQSKLLFPFAHP
jgi:hypothetical protein